MTLIADLHKTLAGRDRPEDVALKIVDSPEYGSLGLSRTAKNLLERGANQARRWRSYMSKSFEKASNLDRQIDVAKVLFKTVPAPEDTNDSQAVHAYLAQLIHALRVEGHDFKANRLTRDQRRAMNIETVAKGHRAYNKRFRLLARMADKLKAWETNLDRRELASCAKARLVTKIRLADLSDPLSACFVAYFTARSNMRSVFTAGKQDRPFDDVCDALFDQLDPKKADWFAIAHVYVSPDVLKHLSEEQKGRFLAAWYGVMEKAARFLSDQVDREGVKNGVGRSTGGINLESMIVRRGNDSSAWNEAAGAFTKARDGWISTLHALGAEGLLDKFAPGKALRLMAADVAWMHRRAGDGLDPDTRVWNALPKPWDVVLGRARCDRAMIEEACRSAGLATDRGWLAPRPKSVQEWRPAPELVYGVQVSCPEFASILKKLGFFAGPSKAKGSSVAGVAMI